VRRLEGEGKFRDHTVMVRTTIDMNLQHAAEQALEMGLREYSEGYNVKQGGMVMVENGGAIRAMVGGRDYGESQFNRATNAMRQPGSSFKIYTYAAAMEKGYKPETLISDAPVTWRGWSPQNYGRSYAGKVTLQVALAKSYNTVPVRLAKDVLGTELIVETAKAMGVQSKLRSDKTIPLGTSEMTVLDQATAYAVLPAGGVQSQRHGIEQVLDYSGSILYSFDRDEPEPIRVLSEEATSKMNRMLVTIPVSGTARRGALENGIVTGGKTGTSQAYRDAWYVGFSGNYTTAVWFGNDDFTSMRNLTGGSLPAMTFKRLMDYAHHGIELRPIPGIENPLPTGSRPAPNEAAPTTAEGDPAQVSALVRPRTLSPDATRLLQSISEKLRKTIVADIEIGPFGTGAADGMTTGATAGAVSTGNRPAG
jgi:penicillin-binding protein 1A